MKQKLLFFMVLALFSTGLAAQTAKPGIVAHRGFHNFGNSAENSISAMQHAVAHDFEGTEFDAQITADGVSIIFHDRVMQDCIIPETPYETLQKQQAFTLKSGEQVPTLDAMLAACRQALLEQRPREKHTRLFFEIKSLAPVALRQHLIGQIIETIGKYQLHDDIFFISFDLEICMMMAKMMPDIPVAYLGSTIPPAELHAKGVFNIDYHWEYLLNHPEWVNEAHKLGMTVNAWTVNDKETALKMLNLGVDYITTDEPLQMREWIGL